MGVGRNRIILIDKQISSKRNPYYVLRCFEIISSLDACLAGGEVKLFNTFHVGVCSDVGWEPERREVAL